VRNLAAVNSINWARIMAQITYYFHAYFALLARSAAASSSSSSSSSAPQPPQLRLRFVVPTGNFGDVLAGYYAKRMGLPVERLVIATNENDILHRFWQGGRYEKHAVHGRAAQGGLAADGAAAHASGVKQTLSPAMDILVSSNFERLLWYLAYEAHMAEIDAGAAAGDGASNGETDAAAAAVAAARKAAGARVAGWLDELKRSGGFGVDAAILDRARRDFASERVSDAETVETVRRIYTATRKEKVPDDKKEGEKERRLKGPSPDGYVLDPHTAVGVTAALRCIDRLPPASSPTTMAHPQSNGAGEKGNGANDDGARAESGDGPSENAVHHVALATAHPAKFAHAVELALAREPGFAANAHLPAAFVGLAAKEKRRLELGPGKTWEDMRALILDIDC
jgi:threonine synthase